MPTNMLRSLSSDNLLPSRSSRGAPRNGSSNSLKNMMSSNHSKRKQLKRANSSKSLRNVMDGMKQGVTGVADGMKQGVTGVADIGKAGAAYGLAGVSNAAELAKKGAMMGGVNVGQLGRAKPSTCRRRQSEFNVLGGSIVSQNFLLQNIKAAEKNNKLTKLELEDLINGNEDPAIVEAVSSLLKNDGGRQWLYIKFIDSLRVGVFGDGLQELQHYEKKRQALWDKIKPNGEAKPIMFSLKVEIEEDTPASTVIDILKELLAYNLVRVEYMGGLFGYKAPEIAEALADLCRPDDPLASIEEIGELKEMILFNLHYAAGGSETNSNGGKSSSPTRDRVWRKVLRRCVKRLGGQVPPSLGDSEHGFGARSRAGRSKSPVGNKGRSAKASPESPRRKTASGNEKQPSNRSLSPPKKRATDPAILPGPAAIARPKPMARRAISEGMLVQMPAMRRAVSMPDGTPPPNSLGSSTHHHKKRRKPRTFANNPIQEVDDTDDDDDDDDDDTNDDIGFNSSCGSMGDDSFADDSSSRRNSDNETNDEGKKKSSSSSSNKKGEKADGKKGSSSSSKTKKEKDNNKVSSSSSSSSRPSRKDSELRRSLSSPNLDGEGGGDTEKAKKKGIKRSTSLKRESSADRSKTNPCYDWSKHSYHTTAVTSA